MTDTSLVEDLAFLYLTFGQATDGTLAPSEMRTLAEKLKQRAPALSLDELGKVLRATVSTYTAIGSRDERVERAQGHAAALRDFVDDKMREAIVNDLVAIAGADGDVSPEELAFIDQTAATLGVTRED